MRVRDAIVASMVAALAGVVTLLGVSFTVDGVPGGHVVPDGGVPYRTVDHVSDVPDIPDTVSRFDYLWDSCEEGDMVACDQLCPELVGPGYGDDDRLDMLWDSCATGDAPACTSLASEAQPGSEYAKFGESFGNLDTSELWVWCSR